MRKCSIIVHPSHFESFGYVAVEAMSNGIPIIASKVGGLKEIIIHKENGLFAEAKNHQSFANNIELLINDAELTRKIILNGHKTVTTKFNEDIMVNNIINQYFAQAIKH